MMGMGAGVSVAASEDLRLVVFVRVANWAGLFSVLWLDWDWRIRGGSGGSMGGDGAEMGGMVFSQTTVMVNLKGWDP